jgi:hypothetical protein
MFVYKADKGDIVDIPECGLDMSVFRNTTQPTSENGLRRKRYSRSKPC